MPRLSLTDCAFLIAATTALSVVGCRLPGLDTPGASGGRVGTGSGAGAVPAVGSGGVTGGGNTGSSSTGGAGAAPGNGTGGDNGGTAGTGASNSSATGGAGTGTGGAGTGNAAGTSFEMIDNLDDNDTQIIMAAGRRGPWHAFNDQNGGNQQPAAGMSFTPQGGGANNTPHAVHTTGSGYQFGGVGFGLNNPTNVPDSPQSQPYDASAYTGITFWAKGNGNLRVEIPQRSFVPTDRGGSCGASCWNVYGSRTLQGRLSGNWQQFTILFSALQRDDGSMSPPFNPSELMGISFKHEGNNFDFWIDEVQFTRGSGAGTGTGGQAATNTGGRSGAATGGTTGTATGGRAGTTTTGGTTGAATGGNTGTVMQPPPITSGGMNGWASRYWDCCKPACGWRDNVSGGNAMVSCNQQNMSLGGDFNARNACDSGGTAFMCWNGVPWSVSNTLSYGFAAASGNNYRCGRCFQVQFTGSGRHGANPGATALNGKTMIVQVINNGGVASDQLDILIPGGGVGALNACTRQWGTSDLGAQYGGFFAGCNRDTNCVRQKCQTVFAGKPDLLAGCDWFLGWFSAADNPNLIFKPIACPAAITQRSGLPDPG